MPWDLWCWLLGHNTICYIWCVGFPWSHWGRVLARYWQGVALVLWHRIVSGWECMGIATALMAWNAYIPLTAFWYILALRCQGYRHYSLNSVWSCNRDCPSSFWWVHVFVWCTILNGRHVPYQRILRQSHRQLTWKILASSCVSIDLACWRICHTCRVITVCGAICWQGCLLGTDPTPLVAFQGKRIHGAHVVSDCIV